MTTFNVEAEYHMFIEKIGAHRVKVLVLDDDLSFEINGMVVFPPSDKKPDWTVYTPTVGKARIIGFNTKETSQKSLLWPDIQVACIAAVQEHQRLNSMYATDEIPEHKEISNKKIDSKLIESPNRLLY
jgi:hypothetical protein